MFEVYINLSLFMALVCLYLSVYSQVTEDGVKNFVWLALYCFVMFFFYVVLWPVVVYFAIFPPKDKDE